MKVNVKALRGALKAVGLVVEKRNTIPILSHVMIESTPGQMTLTATDLDLMIAKTIDLEEAGKNKAMSFCVDAGTLASIAGKLPPEGVATVDKDDSKAGAPIIVKCGRARFVLPTLPTADLPLITVGDWDAQWEQDATELTAMLASVAFAAGTDETRYYLNGVYLHVPSESDCQVAAATDGHRLARFHCPIAEGAETMRPIILPNKAVRALGALLDEEGGAVDVAISATKFRFEVGQSVLTGKAIDGQFPDYTRVIPAGNTIDAWFEPGPLAEAVERVLTISTEKTRSIAMDFASDCVTLRVTSLEHGEASEDVPIEMTGRKLTIGFNGRYLLDTLNHLKGTGAEGSKARVLMSAADSPTLWQQSDEARSTYVLMPMRV